MRKSKTINIYSEEDIKETLKLELFRLTLAHEYRLDGARVQIEEPITAELCMPVGEPFGLPRYSKADIVNELSRKITEVMRGEE